MFIDFCEKSHRGHYQLALKLLRSVDAHETDAGHWTLRRLVAAWHRSFHPERICKQLREAVSDESLVPQVMSGDMTECVARVAEAHGFSREQLMTSENLNRFKISTTGDRDKDWVNLRFLASLLRLGDLLDLDKNRITPLIWDYLAELSPEAEKHWLTAKTLEFADLTPDKIEIKGCFDYDESGHVAAEAHELACRWLDWLKEETENLCKMVTEPAEFGLDRRVAIGRLLPNIDGVQQKGIVFIRDELMELDRRRIIELLGREIYDKGCIFVRELLQNALDATRVQMIRDYRGESGEERKAKFGGMTLDERSPSFWPHKVTGHDDYAITVNTARGRLPGQVDDDTEYVTFEVTDQGTGMTVDQIKKYFLNIGRSYYTTNEFRDEYPLKAISQFGIGFLSCILVAERIEVITRSRVDNSMEGIKLTVRTDSAVYSGGRAPNAPFGTTVRLWIDPNAQESASWNEMPFGESTSYLRDLLGTGNKKGGFITAVKQWVPWPETRIIIDGADWGPRGPHDLRGSKDRLACPFTIHMPGRGMIGRAMILASIKAGLPAVSCPELNARTGVCSIGSTTIRASKASGTIEIVLDLLPLDSIELTASRNTFPRALHRIYTRILRKWADRMAGTFRASAIWESIWGWRFSARWRHSPDELQYTVPVRRNNCLAWERWSRQRFRSEPCLIVPYFAPICLAELRHELPMVGVPQVKPFSSLRTFVKALWGEPILVNVASSLTAVSRREYLGLHSPDEVNEECTCALYSFLKRTATTNRRWKAIHNFSSKKKRSEFRLNAPEYDRHGGGAWLQYSLKPKSSTSIRSLAKYIGSPPKLRRPRKASQVSITEGDLARK